MNDAVSGEMTSLRFDIDPTAAHSVCVLDSDRGKPPTALEGTWYARKIIWNAMIAIAVILAAGILCEFIIRRRARKSVRPTQR